MLSEGYFMAPMQEINDVYASLLAVCYFERYRRDPERFRTGYVALLSGGYDDEPGALLKQRLGIDITAPDFAARAMASLRSELDALYD
jgi:oligoendopeptidase F